MSGGEVHVALLFNAVQHNTQSWLEYEMSYKSLEFTPTISFVLKSRFGSLRRFASEETLYMLIDWKHFLIGLGAKIMTLDAIKTHVGVDQT